MLVVVDVHAWDPQNGSHFLVYYKTLMSSYELHSKNYVKYYCHIQWLYYILLYFL